MNREKIGRNALEGESVPIPGIVEYDHIRKAFFPHLEVKLYDPKRQQEIVIESLEDVRQLRTYLSKIISKNKAIRELD